jgi:lysophospholipid acyltransferase (LPLAT)-like uncharacterized protein
MSEFVVADHQPVKPSFGSRAWRKGLLRSKAFQRVASGALYHFMRLTHFTQRKPAEFQDPWPLVEPHLPAIFALWHGQQMLVPFMWPRGMPVDALISKNADAEINARMLQRMGVRTIRGSGGRDDKQNVNRGGAKALLELRRSLAEGRSVVMIADISHRERRQAGEGVVALARISGRPIIPVAYATSNHYTFENSWDKATLNLPFGKRGFAVGGPIYASKNDDAGSKQREVTEALNDVTRRAVLQAGLKTGALQ